jgi:hypothetical protein
VVMIDSDLARRTLMADGFRAVGCAVLEGATPLEAIVRLGESHFEFDVIAIADSIPSATSEDLRRFVSAEHPNVKLVTIGVDIDSPSGIAHWLSSTDVGADLPRRVRNVVTKPL